MVLHSKKIFPNSQQRFSNSENFLFQRRGIQAGIRSQRSKLISLRSNFAEYPKRIAAQDRK